MLRIKELGRKEQSPENKKASKEAGVIERGRNNIQGPLYIGSTSLSIQTCDGNSMAVSDGVLTVAVASSKPAHQNRPVRHPVRG